MRKKTQEQVLKDFKSKHGELFDYSLVVYVDMKTPMKIICLIDDHGIFEKRYYDHYSKKQGCPKCSGYELKTLEQAIKEFKLVHGEDYDYSLAVYVNNKTLVEIICKTDDHGPFWQSPNSHLSGHGCPKCKIGKNEKFSGNILKNIFKNKVKIESQKYFNATECLSRYRILVDFYFELNDKKYIVEYNGRQHYMPVRFGGMSLWQANQNFHNQQERDRFLKEMCFKENIILIEIDGRKIIGKVKIENYLKNIFTEEFLLSK